MTNINYEKILLETGLATATTTTTQLTQNFGAMSNEFGGFAGGLNFAQHDGNKLKCSTRTVSYSTLHVSTTTKA